MEFRTVRSSVFAGADEVPIEKLPKQLEILKEYVIHPIDYGCRNFTEQIELWKNKELYKHFADSWEQFCREQLEICPDWVDAHITLAQYQKSYQDARKNGSELRLDLICFTVEPDGTLPPLEP